MYDIRREPQWPAAVLRGTRKRVVGGQARRDAARDMKNGPAFAAGSGA
jgi:hypothetical protein